MHTPLITGSDCEGAGEMFQVTTMDLNNIPKTEEGKRRFQPGFLRKTDQPDRKWTAQWRDLCTGIPQHLYISDRLSVQRIPTQHVMQQNSG